MRSWALTDKGIVRKQNQDTYRVISDPEKGFDLYVVCDGMGGAKAGDIASQLAAERFSEEITKHFDPQHTVSDIKRIMQEAVLAANRVVFEKSMLNYDYEGMGTTLVAALVKGDVCVIINVGDSRAYHINIAGIKQITRDHSLIEDLIERGDVTRDEAKKHPGRNLITRAIGTNFNVTGDLFKCEIHEGDHILLCSDGLTNTVSDQEIMYETENSETLEEACQKMLSIAAMRGAPDNITIVLLGK